MPRNCKDTPGVRFFVTLWKRSAKRRVGKSVKECYRERKILTCVGCADWSGCMSCLLGCSRLAVCFVLPDCQQRVRRFHTFVNRPFL